MMRTIASLTLALLFAACAGGGAPAPATAPAEAARGELRITVDPNPIVAYPVGDRYDFPFTIALRETGGSSVTVNRVGIDVLALGGLKVHSEELGAAEIERRGYPRTVAANGEIRYSLTPRKQVPDERLFGSVWGELWAEGTDAAGNPVSTRTRVTIRKGSGAE